MFEPNREDTQYVLSVSYGKDSLACIGACEQLGWRIDRIIHAEVWATDTIPADLPPMVEFKKKADQIILDRWGIEVEHYCAMVNDIPNNYERQFYQKVGEKIIQSRKKCVDKKCFQQLNANYGFPLGKGAWCNSKLKIKAIEEAQKKTHEDVFYRVRKRSKAVELNGQITGFPIINGNWCTSELKQQVIEKISKSIKTIPTVSFVGIAADEQERLARLDGITKVSPLAAIGWTEEDAMNWCIDNDLRSPTYDDANRGGCWFCHNQGIDQLRKLRHNYPDLWALLMKWDLDSPATFRPDGHTVHDFDKRFELEDQCLIPSDRKFRWRMIERMDGS